MAVPLAKRYFIYITFLSIGWWPAVNAKLMVIKCCQKDEVFTGNYNCTSLNQIEGGEPLEFKIPKYVNGSEPFDFYNADEYQLNYGMSFNSSKDQPFFPKTAPNQYFHLFETGNLKTEDGEFSPKDFSFCFDQLLFGESFFYVVAVTGEEDACRPHDTRIKCPCVPEYYDLKCPAPSSFNHVDVTAISLPFLLLTFIVYAVNNELLPRNVHGKSLLCHIASLFFAYFLLILYQLQISQDKLFETCAGIINIMKFCYIPTFCWLNVTSFDIWWYLRHSNINSSERKNKWFIIYSINAWGCFIIISILTYAIESFTSSDQNFEIETCWFDSPKFKKWLFYVPNVPIGTLLFSNLLMYIQSIYEFYDHHEDTQGYNHPLERRKYKERENFIFTIANCILFILMALVWLLDVIIRATNYSRGSYFSYFVSIVYSFLGLIIFVIFVCNKRVLRKLNRTLCPQYQYFNSSPVASTININNTNIVS